MQVLLILALAFALLVAVFAVQNAGTVMVSFLTWNLQTSIVVVILLSAIAGALITGILGLMRQVKMSVRVRSLQAKVARLEKQLAERRDEVGEEEVAGPPGRMSGGNVEVNAMGGSNGTAK